MDDRSAPLRSYRDLKVWQRAMDLVDSVYDLTNEFPQDERFGLVQQIRRAVVSIPSNIAEGYGRKHRREYVNHLSIAAGSRCETETQLVIAVRRNYITKTDATPAWQTSQEVSRMLHRLIDKLKDEGPERK